VSRVAPCNVRYSTGMSPPTSTNDKHGTVIDGTARSAQWRENRRAPSEPQQQRDSQPTTDLPADAVDPAAVRDFASSLMVPASELVENRPEEPAAERPDPYVDELLSGSSAPQPTHPHSGDPSTGSWESEGLDRWFEEQASAVPQVPSTRTRAAGSASLDADGGVAARRVRGRRVGAFRLRVPSVRLRGSSGRRALRSAVHMTRMRVIAGAALVVLSIAAVAVAVSGSPAQRSKIGSALASSSRTTLTPGSFATLISRAARLPGFETVAVRIQRQRRSPGVHRAPRRPPVQGSHSSTGAPQGSSYSPRFVSQAASSPAPAQPSFASTGSSSSSSTGGGASSSVASSPPPARTGPTGPISLIGAGTTPSG